MSPIVQLFRLVDSTLSQAAQAPKEKGRNPTLLGSHRCLHDTLLTLVAFMVNPKPHIMRGISMTMTLNPKIVNPKP